MKIRLSLLIIFLFIFFKIYSQDKNARLYYFTKAWGLLKYYHPLVQKGKIDWNQAFINGVSLLLKSEKNNSPIHDLISVVGPVKIQQSSLYSRYKNSPYNNLDFD